MFYSKFTLSKFVYYLFAFLIIYLPVSRLVEQILLYRFNLSESVVFWSTHVYEPIILIVILFHCLPRVLSRGFIVVSQRLSLSSRARFAESRDPLIKVNKTNWVAGALIMFSIISIIFLSPSISRGIEGFRFSIFFLVIYIISHQVSGIGYQVLGISSKKLINLYLVMAGIIAVWAVAERFLPINYLMNLGLIDKDSCFGFGAHRVGSIYQSVTGIGGPNQLGSYLLPGVFIIADKITSVCKCRSFFSVIPTEPSADGERRNRLNCAERDPSASRTSLPPTRNASEGHDGMTEKYRTCGINILQIIPLIIYALAIAFSLSRSAWVGLFVGLLAYAIFCLKNIRQKISIIAILIILAGGGVLYYLNQPSDLLTHGASNIMHKTAFTSSIAEIKDRAHRPVALLFGSGLGTAGPASLKYAEGYVSESWYLQLLLELGIVGLLLWLIFIALLLRDLYKKDRGLFVGLISVSAVAIFLHTFADNPALSITLFILIGASNKKTIDTKYINAI